MTTEEAIRILDPNTTREALAEIEYYGGFSGKRAKIEACNEACRIAVAALRAQQGSKGVDFDHFKNEPLTLDELRRMDGEPVWFETTLDDRGWHICYGDEDGMIMCDNIECFEYSSFDPGAPDAIIAYRHKPKEDCR